MDEETKLTIEFGNRFQNAYPLEFAKTSLGSDPSMFESPISVCTRPLVAVNINNDEVLNTPLMPPLNDSKVPWSALTDW